MEMYLEVQKGNLGQPLSGTKNKMLEEVAWEGGKNGGEVLNKGERT